MHSELALLTLNADHLVMPPVTRSQVRRQDYYTAAPFPSPSMSQRYSAAHRGNIRGARPAPGRYFTRRASQIQSQEVLSDDSSDSEDEDDSGDGSASDGSDDEHEERAVAQQNARTAKAVRHLTLVIAPDPVEDYAADTSQPLPYSTRRTDER